MNQDLYCKHIVVEEHLHREWEAWNLETLDRNLVGRLRVTEIRSRR